MEWFYELRYYPNYGCYRLYQPSEIINSDGRQKVSEIITLEKC
jgi:hypothetical protein